VKELCKLAKETVQAEKELEELIEEKTPQAALTELFLELKTDQTPAVVERIVTDIDAIVRVVRFPGWQQLQFRRKRSTELFEKNSVGQIQAQGSGSL
jgi:type I restriction enzyme R subunit